MYKFSRTSLKRLATVHPKLVALCFEVAKTHDISILCGHRTEAEQEAAYNRGNSMVMWPHSKHNSRPSRAVDVGLYPVLWSELERWTVLGPIFKEAADRYGIRIKWGGDWTRFKDYPHFELHEDEE